LIDDELNLTSKPSPSWFQHCRLVVKLTTFSANFSVSTEILVPSAADRTVMELKLCFKKYNKNIIYIIKIKTLI